MLAQIALRDMPAWLGAAFSVPSSALLLWCLAPFVIDWPAFDASAMAIFAAIGFFYPATVTLLSFESNRVMGPHVAGSIGNLAPLFAVPFAILVLGEALLPWQAVGIAAVVGGVMLLSQPAERDAVRWPIWAIALPLAAAVIRGATQPAIKLGMALWQDAFAAALFGYTVSAAVLVSVALLRGGGWPRQLERRAVLRFVGVGIGHSAGALLMYVALGLRPVTLVAPLVATYPLATLALGFILLRHEPIGLRIAAGVGVTLAGVVLLILG